MTSVLCKSVLQILMPIECSPMVRYRLSHKDKLYRKGINYLSYYLISIISLFLCYQFNNTQMIIVTIIFIYLLIITCFHRIHTLVSINLPSTCFLLIVAKRTTCQCHLQQCKQKYLKNTITVSKYTRKPLWPSFNIFWTFKKRLLHIHDR